MRHVGFQFPDQGIEIGIEPGPSAVKVGVLTTGPLFKGIP